MQSLGAHGHSRLSAQHKATGGDLRRPSIGKPSPWQHEHTRNH